MAQNEIYKVGLSFTNASIAKGLSTGFYVNQPNVTGFTVGDIGDEIVAWWETALTGGVEMRTLYGSAITLDEVTLRKWDPLSTTIDSYTTGLPSAGTDAGQVGDSQGATLLSLRTAQIGRSYRNRMYLPSMSETDVSGGGTLTSALALDIAEQFVELVQALAAINAGLGAAQVVAYSKTLSAGVPVTSVRCDTIVRTQRRRQLRAASYQIATV